MSILASFLLFPHSRSLQAAPCLSLALPLLLPAGLCIPFSTCEVPSAAAERSRDHCATHRSLPTPSAPESAGRACAVPGAPARQAGGAVEQPRASCVPQPHPALRLGRAPEGGSARVQTPKRFWSSLLMRSQKAVHTAKPLLRSGHLGCAWAVDVLLWVPGNRSVRPGSALRAV